MELSDSGFSVPTQEYEREWSHLALTPRHGSLQIDHYLLVGEGGSVTPSTVKRTGTLVLRQVRKTLPRVHGHTDIHDFFTSSMNILQVHYRIP